MRTLRIDEVEGLPVLGTLIWQPVRRPLGITAFGINAYTAGNAGDEVVEDHTEQTHEEAYIVIRGHATFTVDGEEIDAPWGTIVFLDDPKQQRHAIAKEAGTTVLAIGGEPGVHTISSWEYIFPSLPARNAGDWDTARTILEEALTERDVPGDPLPPGLCRGARRERRSCARGALDRLCGATRLCRSRGRGGRSRLDPRRPALPGLAVPG